MLQIFPVPVHKLENKIIPLSHFTSNCTSQIVTALAYGICINNNTTHAESTHHPPTHIHLALCFAFAHTASSSPIVASHFSRHQPAGILAVHLNFLGGKSTLLRSLGGSLGWKSRAQQRYVFPYFLKLLVSVVEHFPPLQQSSTQAAKHKPLNWSVDDQPNRLQKKKQETKAQEELNFIIVQLHCHLELWIPWSACRTQNSPPCFSCAFPIFRVSSPSSREFPHP